MANCNALAPPNAVCVHAAMRVCVDAPNYAPAAAWILALAETEARMAAGVLMVGGADATVYRLALHDCDTLASPLTPPLAPLAPPPADRSVSDNSARSVVTGRTRWCPL